MHAQVEEDLQRDAGERLVLLAHARLQQRVRLVGVRVRIRLRLRLRHRVGNRDQGQGQARVGLQQRVRLLAQPGAGLPQEGHLLVHEGDAAQVRLCQYLLGLVDRERHLARVGVGVGVGGWGWG